MNNLKNPPSKPLTALLDFPDAQRYLGNISRSTLKKLVVDGALARIHLGRRVAFRIAELDRYIASLEKARGT
jgi:predicted DNA-binding transcriptional regulator AlpA